MTEPIDIDPTIAPSGPGCVECLAAAPDGWWVHLRRCAGCGHVGCCDTSPQQHARRHFETTGHRYIQSYEPGETWFWDFATNEYADGPTLAPPHHHPEDQPVPGPAEAVPFDWQQRINR
jgi:hypothetical protein